MVIQRKRTAGLSEAALERFVSRAKRAVGLRGVVNVLVTTSRELRILNRRFREQDRATDVLSFRPIYGLVEGFAGDVAISADIAAQNARRLGHSAAEEIKILTLHGVLHLAGYDHEQDEGQMARKEARMRRQLSLPVGLIARTFDDSTASGLTENDGKRKPLPHNARGTKLRGSTPGTTSRSRRAG